MVPDPPDVLTSNTGWDIIKHKSFLLKVIHQFKSSGIRTSIFINPNPKMVKAAKEINADRVELYTESYANKFIKNQNFAIKEYIRSSKVASEIKIGVNAGHDLDLKNLKFFNQNINNLIEVSIYRYYSSCIIFV